MTSKISFCITLIAFTLIGGLVGKANALPVIDGGGMVSAASFYSANNIPSKKQEPEFKCKNKLANWIYDAGFRGHNIREAWAIAMRESNGIPSTISGEDYGLFQFNYSSWSGKFDWSRILDPQYNARSAYRLSMGGKAWIPWGMRDHKQWDNESYAGIWSDSQFYAWVIEPYERYYAQFPCKI